MLHKKGVRQNKIPVLPHSFISKKYPPLLDKKQLQVQ